MAEPTVLYEQEGHIAVITLNRPAVRNAMDAGMAGALDAAVERAAAERDVWVVVVKGSGKSLCAGVDLRLVGAPPQNAMGAEGGIYRQGHIGWSAYRLYSLEKPAIAAIRGHAFGGGLGIALACDIRIAAQDTQFSAIFTQRGLAPDSCTSFLLMQSVGYARSCELAFSARTIGAAEAERMGMVNAIVPVERVEAEAMARAREIVQRAPIAVRMAKRALRRGLEREALEAVEYELYVNSICARSQDIAEGAKAFLEKRPPRWTGM